MSPEAPDNRVPGPDELRDMDAAEFIDSYLEPLTRDQLTDLVIYFKGWAPDGLAFAMRSFGATRTERKS